MLVKGFCFVGTTNDFFVYFLLNFFNYFMLQMIKFLNNEIFGYPM